MTNTLPHVGDTMDVVRAGLHQWAADLLRDGGMDLPVAGVLPASGKPTLVLLPYQMVLESSPTNPSSPLVPQPQESAKDALPPAWRRVGVLTTRILVETFPNRPHKGPGIGPIDPLPPLTKLPPSIAAWYRKADPSWIVQNGEPSARLPMIQWQHPFSLAVRFAALVPAGKGGPADLDRVQLRALALVAAGVRLQRHFRVSEPPMLGKGPLLSLLQAFAKVDHPAAAELAESLESVVAPRDLTVGLTPHHELSDQDLALILRALELPMQPSVVFSVRVALGGGPDLGHGALPHLGSVLGRTG